MPVGLSRLTAPINKVEIVYNIRQLSQLVNDMCSDKSRPVRRVISLTISGLFQRALSQAKCQTTYESVVLISLMI